MDVSEVLRLDPTHDEALLMQADLLLRRSETERAIQSLDRSLQYNRDNVGALITRATVLLSKGQVDQALIDAERAAKLDPKDPAAQKLHASVLIAKQSSVVSTRVDLGAKDRVPAAAFFEFTLCAIDAGVDPANAAPALEAIESVLKLEPENINALVMRRKFACFYRRKQKGNR